MTDNMVRTEGLSKIYGRGNQAVHALNPLDLEVTKGEIFGYLGPNGAGKTTTIRILLDFIRPTSGGAQVFGMDVRRDSLSIRQKVGFLPAELHLWRNRTARQTIAFMARVRGDVDKQMRHADVLAERLKLDTSKRIRDYSTGNKRKLGLVLALMHEPALLILDEPTSGLDPLMQQTFNEMMREIRNQGRTVFLSSHQLSEVQAICDRVAILRDGSLKAVEQVERLMKVGYRNVVVEVDGAVPEAVKQDVAQLEVVREVNGDGNRLRLQLIGDFDPLMRTLADVYVRDISVTQPTLEEVFLAYYGNGDDTTEMES